MKRMGKSGLIVAAVSALAIWGSAAQASVLKFTYTFADYVPGSTTVHNTFGVLAEGTLKADNNTFTVSQVDQVYGNGMPVFSDPRNQIILGANTLTLNGLGINFLVYNSDGSIYAQISNSGTVYNPQYVVSTFGAPLPTEDSQVFIPSNYSASVLPEPATAGLLGLMLAGFVAVRRLRQS